MSTERRWDAYSTTPLTADGTLNGIISVADTFGLYTKMAVSLASNTQPKTTFQVKAVLSPTQVQLGLPSTDLNQFSDLTAFTVADSADLTAPRQNIPVIKPDDIQNAVYAREPIVGLRQAQVDKYGRYIDSTVGDDGKVRLSTDSEVNVEVNSVSLFSKPYDAVVVTYPTSTQEQYQSKVGGVSGTNVQLVTVNYSDASKNLITNAFRIDN